MTLIILRFIHINTFTYKVSEVGLNHMQHTGVFKVWIEQESEELRPPDQLTCCPLRCYSPSQNLQTQTKTSSLIKDNQSLLIFNNSDNRYNQSSIIDQ